MQSLPRNHNIHSPVECAPHSGAVKRDRPVLRVSCRRKPSRINAILCYQQSNRRSCPCRGQVPIRNEPRVVNWYIVGVSLDAKIAALRSLQSSLLANATHSPPASTLYTNTIKDEKTSILPTGVNSADFQFQVSGSNGPIHDVSIAAGGNDILATLAEAALGRHRQRADGRVGIAPGNF